MDRWSVRFLVVVGLALFGIGFGYPLSLAGAAEPVPTGTFSNESDEPAALQPVVDEADDEDEEIGPFEVPEDAIVLFSELDDAPDCLDPGYIYWRGYSDIVSIWAQLAQMVSFTVDDEQAGYSALGFFDQVQTCWRDEQRFRRLNNRLDAIEEAILGLRDGDPLPVALDGPVEVEGFEFDTEPIEAAVVENGNASRSVLWGLMGMFAGMVILGSFYRLVKR